VKTEFIPPQPAALVDPEPPRPKNAAEAARQFESLLIAQLLRSARVNASALDSEPDSASETMWDIATQNFSELLANNGGLGMSQIIVKSLEPPR
jgi:Rod binding domain-containing protein